MKASKVRQNVFVRLLALGSLGVATVVVARNGGTSAVGVYALLRVVPALFGVLIACGLPNACTYFVAGPSRTDRSLPMTVLAIATFGGIVGAAAWVFAAPLIVRLFFRSVPVLIVAISGVTVLTQLLVSTVRGTSQGQNDLVGSNRVIVLEEFLFLPAYGILLASGVRGLLAIVVALVSADVLTLWIGVVRLTHRKFFHRAQAPSWDLAVEMCRYGIRGQVGGILTLLNLRLDFAILGAIAGTSVLGGYVVASKFAELLRLLPLAYTYVLYPTYSRSSIDADPIAVRRTMLRAGVVTALAAIPVALFAHLLIPVLYGSAFHGAIVLAYILLTGLAAEGMAGVISAYLYGIGRPGLNSLAIGAGVVVTIVLDIVLIPRFAAAGAAVASSAAYLVSTFALLLCFRIVSRKPRLALLKPRAQGDAA